VPNTALFTVGLALAMCFNGRFLGSAPLRCLLLLPWLLPLVVVVSGALWRWMLDQDHGVLNAALRALHLADGPIPWPTSTSWALPAVILTNIWAGVPFNLVIGREVLRIEPWGTDTLRVRVGQHTIIEDVPGALLPAKATSVNVVAGDKTGSITNGALTGSAPKPGRARRASSAGGPARPRGLPPRGPPRPTPRRARGTPAPARFRLTRRWTGSLSFCAPTPTCRRTAEVC
jgi:hypothetical protein